MTITDEMRRVAEDAAWEVFTDNWPIPHTQRDRVHAMVGCALLTAERVRPHPETPMGEPSEGDVEKTLARYWNSKTDGEPEHAYWPAHFRRDYGDDAVEEERGAMRCALQDLFALHPPAPSPDRFTAGVIAAREAVEAIVVETTAGTMLARMLHQAVDAISALITPPKSENE